MIIAIMLIGITTMNANAAGVTADVFKISKPGSSANKEIHLGGTRKIISNETTGKLQFTNDGVVTKNLGAGEGGSSGGVNDLTNPGFEDGTTSSWTSSGDISQLNKTGCTKGTNCPLAGEISLRFSPNATNDYFESSLATLSEANFGRACEVKFTYIGGDTNLKAEVINGDAEVIGTFKNSAGLNQLPAHSISADESIFFLCPTKTAIVADNDKGNLKIKITNSGGSPAAASDWDNFHLGNLLQLAETTSPDVLAGRTTGTCASMVANSDPAFTAATNSGSGVCDITVASGTFTEVPSCTCEVTANATTDCIYDTTATTTTLLRFRTYVTNTASSASANIAIICKKTQADAKQSVQVYKSIPKAAQNINTFTALLNNTTEAISQENADWINGNATSSGTGSHSITLVSSLFGLAPNCSCSTNTQGIECIAQTVSASAMTVVAYSTTTGSANGGAANLTLTCSRQSTDVKQEVTQPVLINQVQVSKQSGVRTESCYITNAGTPTKAGDTSLCDWISSISDNSTGDSTVQFAAGYFTAAPACTCTASGTNASQCNANWNSTTNVNVWTGNAAGSPQDYNYQLHCTGAR
jgi:hypothetical protein